MPLRLDMIDTDCWNTLESSANDPDSGFHFLSGGDLVSSKFVNP